MELQELQSELTTRLKDRQLIRAVISQPRLKTDTATKIKWKPIEIKGIYHIQLEYHFDQTITHENITLEDISRKVEELLEQYRQFQITWAGESTHIQLSKKKKVTMKNAANEESLPSQLSHNRKKNYVLDPDTIHPFLVHLGVQTKDGKIKSQKQDKFKQINRFVEFVEDSLAYLPTDRPLNIIDFGSGKSYLTFALYYYLRELKGYEVHITGLDLKKDVIAHCEQLARELDYEGLHFEVGDITDYNEAQQVDMVVTLHACDVATDMALARAVKWGAKVILSVPCCQHELFTQLDSPELNVMLRHGLIKERFASLATDSIRAQVLDLVGYETQLVEFVNLENTPKNILIRAYFTGQEPKKSTVEETAAFLRFLQAKPFLVKELDTELKGVLT
ncbi:SAM-dependent methyltransferase [Chryseomicrobium excrementi]|uniref:SAM-dependent methyltransferase n=1 Tax=Chryseomicrobium excrementi TaxID=2041346 RepID=A0A2M9EX89_9BACL|nr:SAM-dependent methyltransferase [Chryseomicrobium excrementi]PJK15832.1 SAM-dependent methyltransferase [Chryseomicrobium excrementi]